MKKVIIGVTTGVVLLAVAICVLISGRITSPFEQQLELGYKYLQEGNYEEAILAFEKAIEIEPKNYKGYLGLSETYVAMGDYDKAYEILEKGIKKTNAKELQEALKKLSGEDSSQEIEEFDASFSSDKSEVNGNNFKVEILNPRTANITLYGLNIQDAYVTNVDDSDINSSEYFWGIEMYGSDNGYSVVTAEWASEPGLNETKSIDDMQHAVARFDGDSWNVISGATMSHTANSITWSFSIPEEYDFDFSNVASYKITCHGRLNKDQIYKQYNVK